MLAQPEASDELGGERAEIRVGERAAIPSDAVGGIRLRAVRTEGMREGPAPAARRCFPCRIVNLAEAARCQRLRPDGAEIGVDGVLREERLDWRQYRGGERG